ncbi:tetratricopeptide repeat protein [Acidobacteria bacterium AB60]|nr:tetratricopeptide repeat protein [Acidobacteria bacterium AB60]
MARSGNQTAVPLPSRRAILKSLAMAPGFFRVAPLLGAIAPARFLPEADKTSAPLLETRFVPHYPAQSPLADVMTRIAPGSDEYLTERFAAEIEVILKDWGKRMIESPVAISSIKPALDPAIQSTDWKIAGKKTLRSAYGLNVARQQFDGATAVGRDACLTALDRWMDRPGKVETAEFEIFGINTVSSSPVSVRIELRYDLVLLRSKEHREERVGTWRMDWTQDADRSWIAHRWEAGEETVSSASGPVFVDVTERALGDVLSYRKQLLNGADYWRTVLDGAVGVDVYCNNGIAAGDYDNDGFDDLYVCQPAGLPNRLYRNGGDGTFEDVTEKAGVGVLDSTACALFADFDNRGLQDLLVVCATGPVLFVNRGDGTFSLKRDAFQFTHPPRGSFTHAAVCDYDRDGRLDIYFCTYMYYLGLDQYHYPIPYYDARNGPPNILVHNEGGGRFVETTEAAGMNADNDRYSFACAWGDATNDGLPDLFVANDFGSSQLYRNNGDGTFRVASRESNVESVGAGMGCSWCDYDNDGHQDVYVPSMWEAAGQRVANQPQFHHDASPGIRELYQRHARGNALYRNRGDGRFENVGQDAGVAMGRWSWSSDFWDMDHDGHADLYVANGYLSEPDQDDLAGFFWRQVVAKSSEDATPSLAYEHGWNAINELVRSDHTWHGRARNVLFLNCGEGRFAEASGAVGLDFLEDSRSFALVDLDHDGRLEVVLKNRNAPQIRVLHNVMQEIGGSLSFRLRGTKSNRDAIGAAITVEAAGLRQTKYLQAGSGFLAQHAKELFFGVGEATGGIRAQIRWPSGLVQTFDNVPPRHRILIEEGDTTYKATAFSAAPVAFKQPAAPAKIEAMPLDTETWLIQPLKAPTFSLSAIDGTVHDLNSQGTKRLLVFWSHKSGKSIDLLRRIQQRQAELRSAGLQVLAIGVDDPQDHDQARALAAGEKFSFPVLLATSDVAGIYNLIYRYMFERRRDMPVPLAFLLDQENIIVKAYQGTFDPARLVPDLSLIPVTASERKHLALPFPGVVIDDRFVRNDFTYGVAMFQHGYFEQAAESFRQVLASKPDNADAYYNLGTLSLRQHNLEQARTYLEKAVKLQPTYPEAWNNLGMIAAELKNFEEAIDSFNRSLAQRPNYAIALLNLGNLYRKQKVFDKASDSLNRALALLPDDPEINYSLGMLYAQQNQMPQAIQYLQRAVELRPDYREALNNLGIVFVRQQDFVQAEEQFKTGIRLSPQFDQSYLNLARLYVLQNDKERARQVLRDLLQVQPQNPSAKQALELLQ